MDELPKTYKPSMLRGPERPEEPREVAFAVGYTKDHISVGMAHGPFPTLEEALEIAPGFSDVAVGTAVLFRFNADGTDEELYTWDREEQCWILN